MSVYRSLTVEILKATYSKVGTESKAGVALFSRICLETSDLGDEPPRVLKRPSQILPRFETTILELTHGLALFIQSIHLITLSVFFALSMLPTLTTLVTRDQILSGRKSLGESQTAFSTSKTLLTEPQESCPTRPSSVLHTLGPLSTRVLTLPSGLSLGACLSSVQRLEQYAHDDARGFLGAQLRR
ncbi:hypothetical protein B0H13DRAFT_2368460 [Mycena leptocephala]|nr:hypothetical protein B0H13DRAFT_2368460 [Mycena leptocephala]